MGEGSHLYTGLSLSSLKIKMQIQEVMAQTYFIIMDCRTGPQPPFLRHWAETCPRSEFKKLAAFIYYLPSQISSRQTFKLQTWKFNNTLQDLFVLATAQNNEYCQVLTPTFCLLFAQMTEATHSNQVYKTVSVLNFVPSDFIEWLLVTGK